MYYRITQLCKNKIYGNSSKKARRKIEVYYNKFMNWYNILEAVCMHTINPKGSQLLNTQELVALTLCTVEKPRITDNHFSLCSTSMDSINCRSCSSVLFTMEKKSMCRCTHVVPTCVVQRAAVIIEYPKRYVANKHRRSNVLINFSQENDNPGSSHHGAVETNLTRNPEVVGSVPGLAQ